MVAVGVGDDALCCDSKLMAHFVGVSAFRLLLLLFPSFHLLHFDNFAMMEMLRNRVLHLRNKSTDALDFLEVSHDYYYRDSSSMEDCCNDV